MGHESDVQLTAPGRPLKLSWKYKSTYPYVHRRLPMVLPRCTQSICCYSLLVWETRFCRRY